MLQWSGQFFCNLKNHLLMFGKMSLYSSAKLTAWLSYTMPPKMLTTLSAKMPDSRSRIRLKNAVLSNVPDGLHPTGQHAQHLVAWVDTQLFRSVTLPVKWATMSPNRKRNVTKQTGQFRDRNAQTNVARPYGVSNHGPR